MLNRVVLVTGAIGALGGAVARAAFAAGARVAITGRRREVLDALTSELDPGGARTLAVAADLAVEADVQRLVEAVAAHWGGVDCLLNVAGGWRGGKSVAEMELAEWDEVMAMNLRSAFLINRAVLPSMAKRGWGRIVNVGSIAAEQPGAQRAAYNVSKAGVVSLTQSIAAEYRRKGIAANVILPSVIDTAANRAGMAKADTSRWVPPEAIAELMLFLCSDAGASLNGASIPVYGAV
ncbi:MAG: SDR family NAD(P)-dependent oxidoreductase [Chloroflexota bacterium]